MTEMIFTFAETVEEKLKSLLRGKLGFEPEIKRTENGKPYIEGNPLFFSIAHSGERAVIALSDKPVGVDMEIFKKRTRESLIKRYSERERAEICTEEDFLRHWTAREAYIKLYGLTLAREYKKLEFFGGELYFEGKRANCAFDFYRLGYGVAALCEEI